jgi:hypothetical protein
MTFGLRGVIHATVEVSGQRCHFRNRNVLISYPYLKQITSNLPDVHSGMHGNVTCSLAPSGMAI